jgi:hypothetical protein
MTTYPICYQRAAQWASVELGTGTGATIGQYGCTMCCVSSVCEYFGKPTDPSQFNQALINVKGYAFNNSTAYDIIRWPSVNSIYGDISLVFNTRYPSPTPADMSLIDTQLAANLPVIVGVSFDHDVTAKDASHYVVLFAKNADGSYQCMDPWTGDETNFNTRYATNGMTAANAILQAICYSGPLPSQNSDLDTCRLDRDANWNMGTEVLAALGVTPDPADKPGTAQRGVEAVTALNEKIADLTKNNTQLIGDVGTARNDAAAAVTRESATHQEESSLAEQLLDAQHTRDSLSQTVDLVLHDLELPPTAANADIDRALATLQQPSDEAGRVYETNMEAALKAAGATPATAADSSTHNPLLLFLPALFHRISLWITQHRGR